MSDIRETQLMEAVNGISVVQRATGSAAISTTLSPSHSAILKEVRIHLSAVGGSGILTITLDNGTGSAYDLVLLSQDMTSISDLLYQPTKPIELKSTDAVVISYANAGSKTYGLEILYSKI